MEKGEESLEAVGGKIPHCSLLNVTPVAPSGGKRELSEVQKKRKRRGQGTKNFHLIDKGSPLSV